MTEEPRIPFNSTIIVDTIVCRRCGRCPVQALHSTVFLYPAPHKQNRTSAADRRCFTQFCSEERELAQSKRKLGSKSGLQKMPNSLFISDFQFVVFSSSTSIYLGIVIAPLFVCGRQCKGVFIRKIFVQTFF